jgi:hypothetical protein
MVITKKGVILKNHQPAIFDIVEISLGEVVGINPIDTLAVTDRVLLTGNEAKRDNQKKQKVRRFNLGRHTIEEFTIPHQVDLIDGYQLTNK